MCGFIALLWIAVLIPTTKGELPPYQKMMDSLSFGVEALALPPGRPWSRWASKDLPPFHPLLAIARASPEDFKRDPAFLWTGELYGDALLGRKYLLTKISEGKYDFLRDICPIAFNLASSGQPKKLAFQIATIWAPRLQVQRFYKEPIETQIDKELSTVDRGQALKLSVNLIRRLQEDMKPYWSVGFHKNEKAATPLRKDELRQLLAIPSTGRDGLRKTLANRFLQPKKDEPDKKFSKALDKFVSRLSNYNRHILTTPTEKLNVFDLSGSQSGNISVSAVRKMIAPFGADMGSFLFRVVLTLPATPIQLQEHLLGPCLKAIAEHFVSSKVARTDNADYIDAVSHAFQKSFPNLSLLREYLMLVDKAFKRKPLGALPRAKRRINDALYAYYLANRRKGTPTAREWLAQHTALQSARLSKRAS
jgi:hypothetical protein